MPVLVTGASGFIGRHAVRALRTVSPQVRAYVQRQEAAEPLRRDGAKVAVGWLDDVDNLEATMWGVHTVCHLAGALDRPDEAGYLEANLRTVEHVVRAATRAGISRILFLSYPNATTDSSNPLLRAKALAEEALAASGIPHVVVRCAPVYGPGRGFERVDPAAVPPDAEMAPVAVEDVAAILAALDDVEVLPEGPLALEGPERLTAPQLEPLVARRSRWLWRRPASWVPAPPAALRNPVALDALRQGLVAPGPDAAGIFKLRRTTLREALARQANGGSP